MKQSKIKKLQQAGWKIGDTSDLLNLSDQEIEMIEIKRSLMQLVRKARTEKAITQLALAELLGSSQSRIAKLENGSADVSLDLILRTLIAMGVSRNKIASTIKTVR